MIGETILHYRILSRLGAGGMGEVFLAEDTRLGRKVALKLLPEGVADEEARRRPDGRELVYSRGRITGDIWIADFGK